MKKWIPLLMCTAIAAAGSLTAVHAEEDEYVLTYLTIHSETDTAYQVQAAVEELYREEVNPNFRIERTVVTNRTSYLQKLKTMVAANEMPDIFDEDADPYILTLSETGQLVNIGDFFDEIGATETYIPVTLEYQTFANGEMYLIPTAFNAEYFWYNTEIFKENGLEAPTTMDELFDVCEKLKENGIVPFAVCSTEKWPLLRYLGQYPFRLTGNTFIENAAVGKESFTSETGMAGINYLYQLGTNGYFQEGFGTAGYSDALDCFLGGKAAMYYMGTWELDSINTSDIADKISFFTLPMTEGAMTGENDMWAGGGTGICLKQETFDEEAQRFWKFYNEHYGELCYPIGGFFSPIEAELPDDVPALTAAVYENMQGIGTYGKCWDVVLDSETFDYMGSEAIALALGQISPEDFAAEMDETVARNNAN